MAANETVNYSTGEIVLKAGSQDRPPVDTRRIIELGRSGLTMVGVDPNQIPVLRLYKNGSVTPPEAPDSNPDL